MKPQKTVLCSPPVPKELVISSVTFIEDALIHFNYIKSINITDFTITLDGMLLKIVCKLRGNVYAVPLSNVRSLSYL